LQTVQPEEVKVELVDEDQKESEEVTQLRSALQAALKQVEELEGSEEYLMGQLFHAHRLLKEVRAHPGLPVRCTCLAHDLRVARDKTTKARSIHPVKTHPQVHQEQQEWEEEEEEEETEGATLEEYAFQLEVALQRERHVNSSLHEQLIGMHQDSQADAEYSQAEAEMLAEHEYASYTNQLLHDREELLGQVRRRTRPRRGCTRV
jgi:hypothetical protein